MPATVIFFDLDDTLSIETSMCKELLENISEEAANKFLLSQKDLFAFVLREAHRLWNEMPQSNYLQKINIGALEGLWGTFTDIPGLAEEAVSYRENVWNNALLAHGIQDRNFAKKMADDLVDLRRKTHRLYPETLEVLQKLKRSYKLGIITNGDSDLQREKIHGANLETYVDYILASGDIGIGKPDPRIFEHALSKFSARPQDAAMVGNNVNKDVLPAEQLGMRAIWIKRDDGGAIQGTSDPKHIIHDLRDIFTLLSLP
jgi:putative hydrolase of the HAD superfamily